VDRRTGNRPCNRRRASIFETGNGQSGKRDRERATGQVTFGVSETCPVTQRPFYGAETYKGPVLFCKLCGEGALTPFRDWKPQPRVTIPHYAIV